MKQKATKCNIEQNKNTDRFVALMALHPAGEGENSVQTPEKRKPEIKHAQQ
jgi:hypothetical protein